MAATLTDTGELTFASFPIEKMETDENGDLVIFGKISDAGLDSDQQIVDPSWMSGAAKRWLSTGGNLRVNHNPQRDPAGIGLEVSTDEKGATWTRGLVVEPVAKQLVSKGALRSFSVGIARPTIQRDMAAKGGRITDGELVEVSLVDRPANARCTFQMVKSAEGGLPEYVGKVFGSDDDIAKALGADVTKGADGDFVNVDLPKGASISISPADFAKLRTFKQELVTKTAATVDAEKRDIDTAARRRLASEGHALPDGSYPIENTEDLHNAAILARSGHGNVEGAERLIAREARERGVANPLDGDDSTSKGTVTDTAEKSEAPEVTVLAEDALKEAGPDVTKDPEDEDKGKPVKKAKKKKKLPPWLNKPSGDDDAKGGDSDGDSCKTAHAWILTGDGAIPDVVCEKCHTTPAQAAGLSGTHDMTCAPVPELLETPLPMSAKDAGPADEAKPAVPDAGMMKTSPEVAAILRFKSAGIDIELGRLHDLTCPAYHPEDVAKCHPFSDLARIDVDAFQREAVKAACGPDMERAKSLNLAWQAAHTLKAADPAQVNDFRMEAHKAFRDANPGPTSALTPGMVTPGKFNRPLITAGHEAASTGHDGPNSSPPVATSAPNAHSFDRPPLSAGHQSPSPSHMKGGLGEYPSLQGTPTQLNYAVMEKERARHALMQMHEHLSRQFPEACPIDLDRPVMQPERHPVPAAVGKSAAPAPVAAPEPAAVTKAAAEPNAALTGPDAETERGRSMPARPEDAVVKDLDEFADEEIYKGFKKARKKLGKKVLSGSMTVDEARAKLGRQFAQKSAEEPGESGGSVDKAVTAELIKSAVAEALQAQSVPLEATTIEAFDPSPAIEAAVTKAVTPLLEKIQAQDTKLAETQRVIDAIADQPDPSTAAFSGLAFNPLRTKAARPAGVATQAEIAERTQNMVMRTLQDKYNSSSDPHEREAYYTTLAKMRGYSEP